MHFLNFNKYNVMPIVEEYGKRWGLSYPQEKRVSKRGPRGKMIMVITLAHFFKFNYHWGQILFFV